MDGSAVTNWSKKAAEDQTSETPSTPHTDHKLVEKRRRARCNRAWGRSAKLWRRDLLFADESLSSEAVCVCNIISDKVGSQMCSNVTHRVYTNYTHYTHTAKYLIFQSITGIACHRQDWPIVLFMQIAVSLWNTDRTGDRVHPCDVVADEPASPCRVTRRLWSLDQEGLLVWSQ